MTYKTLTLDQNTDEWLDYRRNKIGASDAACVMGIGFKSAYQLWLEKLGFGETEVNASMQRGKNLEPIARQLFIEQSGILMTAQVIESTIQPFLIASLDGLDFSGKYAVEIKCPGQKAHEMALDGVVPEYYKPQLQHQMYILGIPMIYYFSYSEGSSKILEVPYDNAYTINMIEKEKEFYKCLQTLEAPAFTERDYLIRTDDLWMEKAIDYKDLDQKIKELEAQKDMTRIELIRLAGSLNAKGGGITVSKIVKRGNVDYKAIPELKGIELDKYRKENTTYWRIA